MAGASTTIISCHFLARAAGVQVRQVGTMPAHQLAGQPPTFPPAQPFPFKPLGERHADGISQRLAGQGHHPRARTPVFFSIRPSAMKAPCFQKLRSDIEARAVDVEIAGPTPFAGPATEDRAD
jgi:hypothetical protein